MEDVYVFRGNGATATTRDERLFVLAEVRDLTPLRDAAGQVLQLPELERMYMEALNAIRRVQSRLPAGRRLEWNRVLLYVWPPIVLTPGEIDALVQRLAPAVEGLGLEKVAVHGRMPVGPDHELRRVVFEMSNPDGKSVVAKVSKPNKVPFEPLTAYTQKVVQLRRRGLMYPYELVRVLAPDGVELARVRSLQDRSSSTTSRASGSSRSNACPRPEPCQSRRRSDLHDHRALPGGHAPGDPVGRSEPRNGFIG